MALQAVYQQFLSNPTSSVLAADASLHYVTTTTSFQGPTEVIKHLGSLHKQVKKKNESILTCVEGYNGIAVETETIIEFLTSGAVYLPGLDDNFLSDRTVSLVISHFVSFDADGKITQIRQSWDQGTLLKQVDVIGKTGRNWPIRDIQDQIRLITRYTDHGSRGNDKGSQTTNGRSRNSSTNIMRDPHASLSLFTSREEMEAGPAAIVISPYAGRRPRQRSFTEILGDEPHPSSSNDSGNSRNQSESPCKPIAPKAGVGKNMQPNRLFGDDNDAAASLAEHDSPPRSYRDRFYRPHPKRFEHFDFSDEPPEPPPSDASPIKAEDNKTSKKSKHSSQWGFEDFVTPQKAIATRTLNRHHQNLRHWGTDTDDVIFEETPVAWPAQHKARREAEKHFEMQDDGFPSDEPRPAPVRGHAHNDGLGLYKDNVVYNENCGSSSTPGPRALGNITNLKDRHRDFDSHFFDGDESPITANHPAGGRSTRIPEDRQKAIKMTEASWLYEDSPLNHKENSRPGQGRHDDRGINTVGDGMGGRKGGPGWWEMPEVGEENGVKQAAESNGQNENARPSNINSAKPPEKERGISIVGDGMDSRKGNSLWDF